MGWLGNRGFSDPHARSTRLAVVDASFMLEFLRARS